MHADLRNALKNAVTAHSKNLVRLAFTYTKNVQDAEDIVQEVFFTYLDKAPVFADEAHEKAWLIRVTANKCKDALRKRKSAPLPLSEDIVSLPKEERAALFAVLELEDKYRLPLHLHYYEGYSIAEIARILRANPATVGSWLQRGRALLKNQLGGDIDA
jgi:RNA polymerase sigma-70 factor (ECF subfamily)